MDHEPLYFLPPTPNESCNQIGRVVLAAGLMHGSRRRDPRPWRCQCSRVSGQTHLDLLQRCAKCSYELRWKLLHKADSVRDEHLCPTGHHTFACSWVQRGKQNVCRMHVGGCQCVNESRLTSIGVAYKGNHRHACRLPAPPVCLPVLTDELDLLAQCCHLVPAHITHTHVRPSHGDMLSLLVKLAPAVGFLKVHLMLATLAAVEHMS
jgi:hypothetical protein